MRQWQVDHRRCYEFWKGVGTNCGLCLVRCPFNKGSHWSHQIAKAAIAMFPTANPLLARLDDFLGYGRPRVDGFWRNVL